MPDLINLKKHVVFQQANFASVNSQAQNILNVTSKKSGFHN